MSDKAITPRALAKFFSENTEKDKVINELFDFFKLDCLENLNLSASGTDELIQKFESSPSYDTELLASIIESIRSSQKAAVKREKQLSKEVASTIKESLLEDVSIKDIAKKMSISYYYMCHIFKNRYEVWHHEQTHYNKYAYGNYHKYHRIHKCFSHKTFKLSILFEMKRHTFK